MKSISLKYPLLFLLAIFLFINISFSQTNNWQRCYRGPSGGYDFVARCLCKSDGNNNLLFIYDHMNNRNVYYKINEYGDTLFSKFYQNRSAKTCVSSGDGGTVFTGGIGFPTTVKIDASGNEIWNNMYYSGNNSTDSHDIIKTSDNFYIMSGGASVVKVDINGNFIWQKLYPFGLSLDYNSIVEAIDGGYLLCGSICDYIGGPIFGIVTKIDTSGTKVWEKRFTINSPLNGVQGLKITKTSFGYIAGGYAWDAVSSKEFIALFKFGLTGNIKDSLRYSFYNQDPNFLSDLKVLSDNRIIVLYYRNTTDSTLSSAFITDTLGHVIVNREYSGADLTMLTKINVTGANTIMFAGTSNHLDKYREYAFLVKTDSTLYAPPVSIRNISQTVPNNFYLKQNYPNPFNSTTQIVFGINKKGLYNLKIYDVTGKLITELFNQNFESGEYKTDFHADKLSSGVYFYKLESSNSIITKKFVLLK